jgi:hypothetical protein|tara:strand:- start:510 stop:1238 length:729 start_codon:yes stop_codon:yes gene_type:complete
MDEINVNNLLRNLLAQTAKRGGITPSTFNLNDTLAEITTSSQDSKLEDSTLDEIDIPDQYMISPDGKSLVKKGSGVTGFPKRIAGVGDAIAGLFNIKETEPITGLPIPLDLDKQDPVRVEVINRVLGKQGKVLPGTGASETDPLGDFRDTLGVIREDQLKSGAQSIAQQGAAIKALTPLFNEIADQGTERAFRARQARDMLASEVQGRIRMANLDSALQKTAQAAQQQAANQFGALYLPRNV